jgi:hypothetical protein
MHFTNAVSVTPHRTRPGKVGTSHDSSTPRAFHPDAYMCNPNKPDMVGRPVFEPFRIPGVWLSLKLKFRMTSAEGDYLLRSTDAHGKSGRTYTYRLTIGPPRDVALFADRSNPNVSHSMRARLMLAAFREGGLEGPMTFNTGLPAGLEASMGVILPGNSQLSLGGRWRCPGIDEPFEVITRAMMNGRRMIDNLRPHWNAPLPDEDGLPGHPRDALEHLDAEIGTDSTSGPLLLHEELASSITMPILKMSRLG